VGLAEAAHATAVVATVGTPTTPHIPAVTAAVAAMVTGTFAARAAAADTATMPIRAITRAIVPCECPDGVRIPMPGEPLFVVDGAGKYRGSVVNKLSPPGAGGSFCGIVYHTQPAQTMQHRGIALIAVTADGSTAIVEPGTPGQLYAPLGTVAVGAYVSKHSVVLRNTFMLRLDPDVVPGTDGPPSGPTTPPTAQ
jgi:hypothetical protein